MHTRKRTHAPAWVVEGTRGSDDAQDAEDEAGAQADGSVLAQGHQEGAGVQRGHVAAGGSTP